MGLFVSLLKFMGYRCVHGEHREGEAQLWECPAMEPWYYVHTLSLAEVGSMVLCVHPWVGKMESVGLCIHLVCGSCHGQVQGSEVWHRMHILSRQVQWHPRGRGLEDLPICPSFQFSMEEKPLMS